MSLIDRVGVFLPGEEYYNEMTPTAFEQYVLNGLKEQFVKNGVSDYSFEHNVVLNASDGSYQIDGLIKFSLLGVSYTTLVECKHYKAPIKREHIQILFDKLRAVDAQKGIFVTTSYFQSGAIKYASEHGIALISIIDGKLTYQARSEDWMLNPTIPPWVEIKLYIMALQTQIGDNSVSVSYIDSTNGLFEFITKNTEAVQP